jgi:hypothetical protein
MMKMSGFVWPDERGKTIVTCVQGGNSDLVANACLIYLQEGQEVADTTFGRGVFWKKVDVSKINLWVSDKITCPENSYDFRDLPYCDSSFNHVVFDPPYMHSVGNPMVEANYQNAATTKGMCHKDIIGLYREGMAEACRILKPEGLLWVKCQDEIESSKMMMSHLEIHDIAIGELKMTVQDLFILLQSKTPVLQHKTQKHARKNHSYLWLFKKPK